MKLHRFFVDILLARGEMTIRDAALAHQIHTVLKLRPGEKLTLFDASGIEAAAIIAAVEKKTIRIRIEAIGKPHREPDIELTLYAAIVKHKHFEMIAEKATEIGVSCIVPLITKRTVKRVLRTERILKIIKEAAEQSGRTRLPTLADPSSFAEALQSRDRETAHFFFNPSGNPLPQKISAQKRAVWIGPEGGWTDDELAAAQSEKLYIASFGNLIFRAETAAIVGAFAVLTAPLSSSGLSNQVG